MLRTVLTEFYHVDPGHCNEKLISWPSWHHTKELLNGRPVYYSAPEDNVAQKPLYFVSWRNVGVLRSAKAYFSLHSIQPHFNERPRKLKKPLCHCFRVVGQCSQQKLQSICAIPINVRSMLTKRTNGRLKTPGCCVRLPRMIHGLGAPLRSMDCMDRMDLGLIAVVDFGNPGFTAITLGTPIMHSFLLSQTHHFWVPLISQFWAEEDMVLFTWQGSMACREL